MEKKLGLEGKTVWKELNGRMVEIFIPTGEGPTWEEVKPIFEKMGKILEKRGFKHFKIPKD